MFKEGDKLIRVSLEHETTYAGGAHSEEEYPLGSVVTFKREYDFALFDIWEPSSYYMVYGDWEPANFSLENE